MWELVSSDQEYEKCFRYRCFMHKFLKALPSTHKRQGCDLLNQWVEAGQQEGIDVARSIICTLESEIEIEIRDALMFAVRAITHRNLSMLSQAELADAENMARKVYVEALEDLVAENAE